MKQNQKIGLGGGCHWCTEAVFQSLKGVHKVAQGFIASNGENNSFSEAVIVHFNEQEISLKDIIAVHLYTHKSTSQHSMRGKYRSAIYTFPENDSALIVTILGELQAEFEKKLITKVVPYFAFKPSETQFQNYYLKNPDKPFCKTHIAPKLRLLLDKFADYTQI